MTRDEIISGLEREIKSIRREPHGKMLGVCITVDEAEDIVALLKEADCKPDGIPVEDPGGICPRCKMPIYPEDYPHFCGFCGQAVEWNV